MSDRRRSAQDALETDTFYRLYAGACRIEDYHERLKACFILLLAGRLGLRLAEIQHLREAWIDWKRGEICIPKLDPCACRRCWIQAHQKWLRDGLKEAKNQNIYPDDSELRDQDVDRARIAEVHDPQKLLDIVYQEQFSPKSERGARVIAFGWSERITAVLFTFFDEYEYLDMTQEGIRKLTKKAARKADHVNPKFLSPHRLRATGETFLADAGVSPKMLRDLAGWERLDTATSYVRKSGRYNTHTLYRIFGKEEWAPPVVPEHPDDEFPVACLPTPFQGEPFEPPHYTPDVREERALEQRTEYIRLRHPRDTDLPTGRRGFPAIDYDPDEHDLPGHRDRQYELDEYNQEVTRATTLFEFCDPHNVSRARDAENGRYRREAAEPTELNDYTDDDNVFMLLPLGAPLIGMLRARSVLGNRLKNEFAGATLPSPYRAASGFAAYALLVVWVGVLLAMIGPDVVLSPSGLVAGIGSLTVGLIRTLQTENLSTHANTYISLAP